MLTLSPSFLNLRCNLIAADTAALSNSSAFTISPIREARPYSQPICDARSVRLHTQATIPCECSKSATNWLYLPGGVPSAALAPRASKTPLHVGLKLRHTLAGFNRRPPAMRLGANGNRMRQPSTFDALGHRYSGWRRDERRSRGLLPGSGGGSFFDSLP